MIIARAIEKKMSEIEERMSEIEDKTRKSFDRYIGYVKSMNVVAAFDIRARESVVGEFRAPEIPNGSIYS